MSRIVFGKSAKSDMVAAAAAGGYVEKKGLRKKKVKDMTFTKKR